jgi:hypothetical protein
MLQNPKHPRTTESPATNAIGINLFPIENNVEKTH